jgi:hypothetical protein
MNMIWNIIVFFVVFGSGFIFGGWFGTELERMRQNKK